MERGIRLFHDTLFDRFFVYRIRIGDSHAKTYFVSRFDVSYRDKTKKAKIFTAEVSYGQEGNRQRAFGSCTVGIHGLVDHSTVYGVGGQRERSVWHVDCDECDVDTHIHRVAVQCVGCDQEFTHSVGIFGHCRIFDFLCDRRLDSRITKHRYPGYRFRSLIKQTNRLLFYKPKDAAYRRGRRIRLFEKGTALGKAHALYVEKPEQQTCFGFIH